MWCGRSVGYSSGAVWVTPRVVSRSPSSVQEAATVFSEGVSSQSCAQSCRSRPAPSASASRNSASVVLPNAWRRKYWRMPSRKRSMPIVATSCLMTEAPLP